LLKSVPKESEKMLVRGFDPITGKDARIVILGTLPGDRSLEVQQYYADPGNALWPIVQQLFGIDRKLNCDEIKQCLIENRIAIWDVLEQAERNGSQDNKIIPKTKKANDFLRFFAAHPSITDVFFNGKLPKKYFDKLVTPKLKDSPRLNAPLPSTSGANTHCKREKKVELWTVQLLKALA
jgi:hypoxanthine-DNA glycosylase